MSVFTLSLFNAKISKRKVTFLIVLHRRLSIKKNKKTFHGLMEDDAVQKFQLVSRAI